MPHSITPEAMSSPNAVKDEPTEETAISNEVAPAPAADVDMAGAEENAEENAEESKEDTKKDIKNLEDLFDDDDSDDEFPSSAPVQPSSQVAPP